MTPDDLIRFGFGLLLLWAVALIVGLLKDLRDLRRRR